MESIFTLLSQIENDPKKYLGYPSCEKLRHFLTGWGFQTLPRIDFPDDSFRKWICTKHPVRYAFENEFIISQLIAGNDHDAFYFYFDELNHYRKINPRFFEGKLIESPYPYRLERRELIACVAAKPGMYIGGKAVTRLRALLDGDSYARRQAAPGIKLYADLFQLGKLLSKVEETDHIIPCETLALIYCAGDEASAFDWLIEKIEASEAIRTPTTVPTDSGEETSNIADTQYGPLLRQFLGEIDEEFKASLLKALEGNNNPTRSEIGGAIDIMLCRSRRASTGEPAIRIPDKDLEAKIQKAIDHVRIKLNQRKAGDHRECNDGQPQAASDKSID